MKFSVEKMQFVPGRAFHPKAMIVGENDDTGMPIYKCPECGKEEDCYGCDVLGADPGCLFCTNCHCEFKT